MFFGCQSSRLDDNGYMSLRSAAAKPFARNRAFHRPKLTDEKHACWQGPLLTGRSRQDKNAGPEKHEAAR